MSATSHAGLIWDIAELLRGHYKRHENGDVILPLTVIRRLDCVLAPTRAAVQAEIARLGESVQNKDPFLKRVAGVPFYNTSRFDLPALLTEPNDIAANLNAYLNAFSPVAREIVEKFSFAAQIERLDRAGILYLVVKDFAAVDLHPDRVSNRDMGIIYEELIRRAYEQSNEEAGDHFTPREVVRLMVQLLLGEDMDDADGLTAPYAIRTLYDPACGTGGMLTVAEEFVRDFNPTARLELFGQEINEHTYATCKADMLLKGQNPNNIARENTLSDDQHEGAHFDYLLSNPPYGVDWKSAKDAVEHEHRTKGVDGRFGAGLPPIDDGQLLFLQHMIAKMKPVDADGTGGSRIAIIMNGSPLFSGNAGGGESNIRKWIIEHDWLEGIVALPTQLFYNTDIATYIWLVTNRKRPERRERVQIVDATGMHRKMRKSLGKKRNEIVEDDIAAIVRLYRSFAVAEHCKLFPNEAFGYRQIRVERPLRRTFAATPKTIKKVQATTQFQALVDPKGERCEPRARRCRGGGDAATHSAGIGEP